MLKKIVHRSLYHSLHGLRAAFKDELAFRVETILSLILIPLALLLKIPVTIKIFLISSWLLVPIIELINSSIEALVDRISLDIHPLSKKIKDMGSAAVFLSIVNAIIVWTIALL